MVAPPLDGSLDRVLSWSSERDFAGYSKFDVFNSPLMRLASLGNRHIRLVMTAAWSRSPINLRPLVGVTQSRNPKGIGLFALAYLHRYQRTAHPEDLKQARELLDWLDRNSCTGFSGKCWGYDHPWQSVHFYAPRYSPNIVVTGNIAYAFLEAFEATGEQRYLDVARSVATFLLDDLETPFSSPEMRSISYIPGNRAGVLNINGLAATILSWVSTHTGEEHLAREARRLMTFLVDKQTDYGAWYYAWPDKSSHVKHDNYHTGNVLDWVLEYSHRSGDQAFLPNYRKGLEYYRKLLFAADGRPKWMSHKDYPADAHSAAQGIVTFTKAALWLDDQYLADAGRTARWAIDHMQAPEGYFVYQKGRYWTKSYTFMRWCNAWMAYSLSLLSLTESRFEANRSQGAVA